MQALESAIMSVPSLKPDAKLFHKGGNYATFDSPTVGMFDIMPNYINDCWEAIKNKSTWEKGADIKHLFFIN